MKTLNILDPIVRIYFIFGPNIVLHRAINNFITNFEKIQNGHHAGRFSHSAPQMKTLNISEPIVRIYFIFGPNIVLHRAINNLIKNIGKIQNGHHAGRFSPSAPRLKTLLISESIWQIYFIFVKNVDLPRAITIRI